MPMDKKTGLSVSEYRILPPLGVYGAEYPQRNHTFYSSTHQVNVRDKADPSKTRIRKYACIEQKQWDKTTKSFRVTKECMECAEVLKHQNTLERIENECKERGTPADQAEILMGPAKGYIDQHRVNADHQIADVAGEVGVPRHGAILVARREHVHGGYQAAAALVNGEMDAEAVLAAMESSGLRGLGGAGFPAGRKWRIVALDANNENPGILALGAKAKKALDTEIEKFRAKTGNSPFDVFAGATFRFTRKGKTAYGLEDYVEIVSEDVKVGNDTFSRYRTSAISEEVLQQADRILPELNKVYAVLTHAQVERMFNSGYDLDVCTQVFDEYDAANTKAVPAPAQAAPAPTPTAPSPTSTASDSLPFTPDTPVTNTGASVEDMQRQLAALKAQQAPPPPTPPCR